MTTFVDAALIAADGSLRTLFAPHRAVRPTPTAATPANSNQTPLNEEEKRLSGALMRVNHVGEICAQALYTSQALAARLSPGDPSQREQLAHHLEVAGQDETDHLAWCKQRLEELGDRPSLLNPFWYAGAFGIGLTAGLVGKAVSLGFVIETERQVEAHLDSHMDRLPAGDHASRAIVQQMKDDEVRHANDARDKGGMDLPTPITGLMKAAAKVMTTVAHRI